MALTRPTLDEIYNRIKGDFESRLSDGLALFRRAVLLIIAKIFAGVSHLIHGFVVNLGDQLLPDRADDPEFLNRHALMWGLIRIAGGYATGTIEFTGVDNSVIPAGTVLQDADGYEFKTDIDAQIAAGSAIVPITASEIGAAGNTVYNTLALVSPIAGVDDTGTIDTVLTGGADPETDDALRTRLLARIRRTPGGGTLADYMQWALDSNIEIKDSWAIENYAGIGTVGVIVVGKTVIEPSPTLLQEVKDYIDARRPLGASVIVDGVTSIDLQFFISMTPNTSDLQALVQANLQTVFDETFEIGVETPISKIYSAIIGAGVTDFEITSVEKDGSPLASVPPDNITWSGFEYPNLLATDFQDL